MVLCTNSQLTCVQRIKFHFSPALKASCYKHQNVRLYKLWRTPLFLECHNVGMPWAIQFDS